MSPAEIADALLSANDPELLQAVVDVVELSDPLLDDTLDYSEAVEVLAHINANLSPESDCS